VVIGLMVLARIDTAFLAVVLGLNELRKSQRIGLGTMLARGAVLGVAALAVSSPWWIYNTVYFGSPMPTSGAAQQILAIDLQRFEDGIWALRLVAVPWLFLGYYEGNCIPVDLAWPFHASFEVCLPSYYIDWPLAKSGVALVTLTGIVRTVLLVIAAILLWR